MIYIASGHIGVTSALDHPRFCFHKHAATVTASGSAPGTNPAWVMDGQTWNQWRADSGNASLTLTFASAQDISYVGIAAHDLDLQGSTIALQINTGSGFADVPGLTGIQPSDDGAILFLLGPITVTAVRLVITGASAPYIGVFQAGLAMELPRRATYTALPISESEQTTYRHAQAVKGQVLGRSVQGAELAFEVQIDHLSEDWRMASGVASWQAFTAHVRDVGPFFVASRPIKYPDDVAYGQAVQRPRFERSIPNHNVAGSVGLTFKGYKRP